MKWSGDHFADGNFGSEPYSAVQQEGLVVQPLPVRLFKEAYPPVNVLGLRSLLTGGNMTKEQFKSMVRSAVYRFVLMLLCWPLLVRSYQEYMSSSGDGRRGSFVDCFRGPGREFAAGYLFNCKVNVEMSCAFHDCCSFRIGTYVGQRYPSRSASWPSQEDRLLSFCYRRVVAAPFLHANVPQFGSPDCLAWFIEEVERVCVLHAQVGRIYMGSCSCDKVVQCVHCAAGEVWAAYDGHLEVSRVAPGKEVHQPDCVKVQCPQVVWHMHPWPRIEEEEEQLGSWFKTFVLEGAWRLAQQDSNPDTIIADLLKNEELYNDGIVE